MADEGESSGRLRLDEDLFLHSQKDPVEQTNSNLTFEYEYKKSLSENWRVLFEPRIHASSDPKIVNTNFDGDFRDSLVETKRGNVHLQAGSFIKEWEGTDGTNPMDIATMKSYKDPMNSESLGSWGISASGSNSSSSFNWEVFYVPSQTQPRLPGDNSPWLPRSTTLPLAADNEELLIPNNPEYQILSPKELNSAMENNYGGRLQFHGESWDLSLAGFEGASQTPILQPIIQGQLVQISPKTIVQMDNPIQIQTINYRRRTVAAAITSTHDSWVYRLAGKHEQPLGDSPLLPSWTDQVVGGVEKTVTLGGQNVIFSVLYSYETESSAIQPGIIPNPDPFWRSFLLGMRYPLRDDLVLFVGGVKSTLNSSFLARLNLHKNLGAHWGLEANLDWNQGPADSLFGVWQDQSRLRLSTVYQF